MKAPPDELAADLVAHTDLVLRSEPVATFDEVAAAVGRSRAALYYYFSGRDDLVAFVLLEHVEGGAGVLRAADPGEGSGADRLQAVLAAALGYLAERPQVCAGLLSAASASGSLADVLAANDQHVAAPVRALIALGNEDGSLAAASPETATDVVLGALLLAVIGRWARGDDPTDEQHQTAVLHQAMAGLQLPA